MVVLRTTYFILLVIHGNCASERVKQYFGYAHKFRIVYSALRRYEYSQKDKKLGASLSSGCSVAGIILRTRYLSKYASV